MKINNPYLDRKRELVVILTKEDNPDAKLKLQAEYDAVEKQSREFIQSLLEQKGKEIAVIKTQATMVKQNYPKLKDQYKESVRLYQAANQVMLDIREIKWQIKTEAELQRKK